MNVVAEIAPVVGVVVACAMLALARATYYRARVLSSRPASARQPSHRALSGPERGSVLAALHEPSSSTSHPRRSWRRSSTKAATSAPNARCTAFLRPIARCASAATNSAIPTIRFRSSSPSARTDAARALHRGDLRLHLAAVPAPHPPLRIEPARRIARAISTIAGAFGEGGGTARGRGGALAVDIPPAAQAAKARPPASVPPRRHTRRETACNIQASW